MSEGKDAGAVQVAEDVCALSMAQRVAALLDHDVQRWRNGDALPRGWHVVLFGVHTRQSELRPDGVANLGVTLPDFGMPRLVMGGRRTRFTGDIPIGAPVRRRSRLASATPKTGRSGRIMIATVEHEIFAGGDERPVIIEEQDYVFREAATGGGDAPPAPAPAGETPADIVREMIPDETMLFRYSSMTANPHRIHYDHPFATQVEKYRGLVVNGGLSVLLLIEFFRDKAGRQPSSVTTRNLDILYCREAMLLKARRGEPAWRLWSEEAATGRRAVEMTIE